jgi:hypothetical protein
VRVLTLEDRADLQPFRQLGRHILHGMHRDVRAVFQHALFQLLHEQALAADLRQRAVQHAVALGTHGNQLDGQPGVGCLQS